MSIAIIIIYTAILVAISVVDIKHRLILDKISYPAMGVALLLAPFGSSGLLLSLAGGAAGFILMALYMKLSNGAGFGDVKLAALVGLMVGFPDVLLVICLSCIISAIIASVIIRLKKENEVPFAPAMALATVSTLCWQIRGIG